MEAYNGRTFGQRITEEEPLALAFVVMMQAAKSAQEDLKSIMAEVKAVNAAKSAMRSLLAAVRGDIVENLGRQTLVFADGGLGSEAACHKVPVPRPQSRLRIVEE